MTSRSDQFSVYIRAVDRVSQALATAGAKLALSTEAVAAAAEALETFGAAIAVPALGAPFAKPPEPEKPPVRGIALGGFGSS